MKKILAVSTALMLVASNAFAISIGGDLIGGIRVLQGNTEDGDVTASAAMDRIRIEASGQNADGTFGGYIRAEGPGAFGASGYGWWRPTPMFWLAVGGNPDNFFGQEGVTGWMYHRFAHNAGVANNGNVWGGDYTRDGLIFRRAFYEGFGTNGLLMTITPAPVVNFNIAIPFMPMNNREVADVFAALHAQVVFNQGWGNVAVTYRGYDGDDFGSIFAYLHLRSIQDLGLDFGIGFDLLEGDSNAPLFIGLGAEYTVNPELGLRARLLAGIPLEESDPFSMLLDVMPFFRILPNLTAFFSVGFGMDVWDGETDIGWHVNPYLELGTEWGPIFFAGVRIWSGIENADPLPADTVLWSVPIGIRVNF